MELLAGDYVLSAIDDAQPHVPPLQYMHDMLIPTLFQEPGLALQFGIGYGAMVYALEALGYSVDGLDTNLDLWRESMLKLGVKSSAHIHQQPHTEFKAERGRYNLIVADIAGGFRNDPSMVDPHMFMWLDDLLLAEGVLSFNVGMWPVLASKAIFSAASVFNFVAMIPNTQTMLASQAPLNLYLDDVTMEEPDWLCASGNLYLKG